MLNTRSLLVIKSLEQTQENRRGNTKHGSANSHARRTIAATSCRPLTTSIMSVNSGDLLLLRLLLRIAFIISTVVDTASDGGDGLLFLQLQLLIAFIICIVVVGRRASWAHGRRSRWTRCRRGRWTCSWRSSWNVGRRGGWTRGRRGPVVVDNGIPGGVLSDRPGPATALGADVLAHVPVQPKEGLSLYAVRAWLGHGKNVGNIAHV